MDIVHAHGNPFGGSRTLTALIDLDDTLAVSRHRWALRPGPDRPENTWEDYHAAARDDAPNRALIDVVNGLALLRWRVVIVTGRSGTPTIQNLTRRWLEAYGVQYHRCYLRAVGDHRPNTELKIAVAEALTRGRLGAGPEWGDRHNDEHQIRLVLDDHPDVCDALHTNPEIWAGQTPAVLRNVTDNGWDPAPGGPASA